MKEVGDAEPQSLSQTILDNSIPCSAAMASCAAACR